MLTAEQRANRAGKMGASFVPALMAGDEARIVNEWMRLVEHPDYVEEDLSGNWPVQFGIYLEPFVLDWHEKKTGQPLTARGGWMPHPELAYVGCTLDAFRCHDNTVIDAKTAGKWRNLDDVLAYYPGQLVVQKACTKADHAALLVCHGGAEPEEHQIIWSEEYEREVWQRIGWFWAQVESLQAPGPLPGVKAALIPAHRVVDMQGNNSWANFAATWLANRDASRLFADAAKELKALVEPDVGKAYGHGIAATRAKNGALTIKGI